MHQPKKAVHSVKFSRVPLPLIPRAKEFDLYHWPVNSGGLFLGFTEVKQFNSIKAAEKALGNTALANVNRQGVSDAINDFRAIHGKPEAEKLATILRKASKAKDWDLVDRTSKRLRELG